MLDLSQIVNGSIPHKDEAHRFKTLTKDDYRKYTSHFTTYINLNHPLQTV